MRYSLPKIYRVTKLAEAGQPAPLHVGRPRVAIPPEVLMRFVREGLGPKAIAQELFDRGLTGYLVSPMTVWRRLRELRK